MRGSVRLFKISGISVDLHFTFLLLLLLVLQGGPKSVVLITGVFVFVTLHELCHSLTAQAFGIKVSRITLLPIGGVASMTKMPGSAVEELLISLAGPVFNLAVVAVFFYPMKIWLGPEVLFAKLSTATWPLTFAYIYWINLILAIFNMLPAFPMDGGRVLRSMLAIKLGNFKATRIASWFGHVFSIIFVGVGIINLNIVLIAIGVFIYISASAEMAQARAIETLKKYTSRDILSRDFVLPQDGGGNE